MQVLSHILRGAVEGILMELFNKRVENIIVKSSKRDEIYEIIIEVH